MLGWSLLVISTILLWNLSFTVLIMKSLFPEIYDTGSPITWASDKKVFNTRKHSDYEMINGINCNGLVYIQ